MTSHTTSLTRGLRQTLPLLTLGIRRLLGKKSPFSMSLSITNRCNFNCAYCDLPSQRRPELSTAQWCDIIDELRDGGMGRTSLIGGEPMLREDLGEIIGHLHRRSIHAAMNTNGWHTVDRLDDLRTLDLVCVTLDGPPEVHDHQRRQGSYERVLAGIRALRRVGVTVVTMTVVTREDPAVLRHVLDVARDLGIVSFFQIEHDASADVLAPVAPQLTDSAIARIAQTLLDLKDEGLPVGNSRLLLERHLRDGRRIGGTCERCFAGRYFGYILSDGTVAPCLLTQWTVDEGNGLERGCLAAFHELEQPRGPGCACMPTHEVNAILRFDPKVLLNAVELAVGSRNSDIRRR